MVVRILLYKINVPVYAQFKMNASIKAHHEHFPPKTIQDSLVFILLHSKM